ncbi:hypothetical protein [Hymenobacter sp. BT491]|uniref:hypothetical protein n=1 Tax=Hymenobacter sp. BT491 TaxID=2766779 RepID=UPI00165365F5|nr:hypothetical protein [Hymenobacter sp. BT491]MBC6989805.1 hypothetical protein [Hymenobacter sp. BT491]
MTQQLLFVYNADSGLANGLLDTFHKILSPRTYPCSLCGITYGTVGMRTDWKQYLQALPVKTQFLHRDEFLKAFPQLRYHPLPAVFSQTSPQDWELFLSKTELDQLTLPSLMQRVTERLQLPAA